MQTRTPITENLQMTVQEFEEMGISQAVQKISNHLNVITGHIIIIWWY